MKHLFGKKSCVALSLILVFALVLGVAPNAAAITVSNREESNKLVDMLYEEIRIFYEDTYNDLYDLAEQEGLIDEAIAGIDKLIQQVEEAKAEIPADVPEEMPEEIPEEVPENWMEQIPQDVLDRIPADVLEDLKNKYDNGEGSADASGDYADYVATVNQLREETDLLLAALNDLKASVAAGNLATQGGLLRAVEDIQNTIVDIELLWIVLAAQSDVEISYNDIVMAIDALHVAESVIRDTLIPTVNKAMKVVGATLYDPLRCLLGTFLDQEVGSAQDIADALGIVAGMSEAEIKQRVKDLIYNATHEEYHIDANSNYLAFGNIYNIRNDYTFYLGQKLDVSVTNRTQSGMTIEQMADSVSSYESDILAADLITLNFGLANSLMDVITNIAAGSANYEMNWELYLGANGMNKKDALDSTLADAYNMLTDNGVDGDTAKSIVTSLEYYIYQYVAHVAKTHETVEKIHAINPNALVVVVGAYNPLGDITYTYEDTTLNVGQWLDGIFDVFGAYDLLYAVVTENTTYVAAPNVAVDLASTELNADLYANLSVLTLMPSAQGHEYIAQEIRDALIVTRDGGSEPDDPNTGDTLVFVAIATLALSAAAILVLYRKRYSFGR